MLKIMSIISFSFNIVETLHMSYNDISAEIRNHGPKELSSHSLGLSSLSLLANLIVASRNNKCF